MSSEADSDTQALRGSGLVRQLAERWQAAMEGDTQALMASGEELPPLSAIGRAALSFKGARGAGSKSQGLSPQLLLSILQDESEAAEEALEEVSVEERRPGGAGGIKSSEDGGTEDGAPAEDPRRTSLIQFVKARLRNRGDVHLVVKMPKPSQEVAKILDVAAMSEKEAGLYKHVLPNMAALWPNQQFDVFPKCYYASSDILVLEDLRAQGFAPVDIETSGGLSEAECAAALRALALFHAASLAYKAAGVAEAGSVLAEAGHETVYTSARRPALEHLLDKAAKNTAELLKRHPKASKYTTQVQSVLSDRFDRLVELHRVREPMAVLTHGDPRANNMLFRRAPGSLENALEPELEARLVDLRACRYGSPALDLARLMWGGGASAGARAELDTLLRGYYRTLSKALRAAPGAPQPPFSLAELRKEVEHYAVYGLLTADLSLRLQLNAPGRDMVAEAAAEDGERAVEDFLVSNAPGDTFARAFGDLVLELADKGLLK